MRRVHRTHVGPSVSECFLARFFAKDAKHGPRSRAVIMMNRLGTPDADESSARPSYFDAFAIVAPIFLFRLRLRRGQHIMKSRKAVKTGYGFNAYTEFAGPRHDYETSTSILDESVPARNPGALGGKKHGAGPWANGPAPMRVRGGTGCSPHPFLLFPSVRVFGGILPVPATHDSSTKRTRQPAVEGVTAHVVSNSQLGSTNQTPPAVPNRCETIARRSTCGNPDGGWVSARKGVRLPKRPGPGAKPQELGRGCRPARQLPCRTGADDPQPRFSRYGRAMLGSVHGGKSPGDHGRGCRAVAAPT